MKSCKTCDLAIFDPIWGEYICRASKTVVMRPDDKEDCESYKKGEPTGSKRVSE